MSKSKDFANNFFGHSRRLTNGGPRPKARGQFTHPLYKTLAPGQSGRADQNPLQIAVNPSYGQERPAGPKTTPVRRGGGVGRPGEN